MAWTAPKTFVAQDILLASEMNTYVRDNLDFIMNTAMSKILAVSTTWRSVLTIAGAERTLSLLAFNNPVFSTEQQSGVVFVAWGSYSWNPTLSTATPQSALTLRVRQNQSTQVSAPIGLSYNRQSTAINRRGATTVLTQCSGSTGVTSVFFNGAADFSDSFDVNYLGEATWQGAMCVPG